MNRTDITLTWPHRLALLFGGRLCILWRQGATGAKIVNVHIETGKPRPVPLGNVTP